MNLQIVRRKRYAVVHVKHDLSGDPGKNLTDEISDLLRSPCDLVIDFSLTSSLSDTWTEAFQMLQQQLDSAGKRIVGAFASEEVLKVLQHPKTGKPIEALPSLATALDYFDAFSAPPSNAQFIKNFVNATLRTMYVQVGIRCRRGKVFVKHEHLNSLEGEISGLVNVLAKSMSYIVIISFPKDTFLKIISKMLGETYLEITDDIKDGAAELINIIFGLSKSLIGAGRDSGIQAQLPKLIEGNDFPGSLEKDATMLTLSLAEGRNVIVPFITDLGEFFVRVWFPEKYIDEITNN